MQARLEQVDDLLINVDEGVALLGTRLIWLSPLGAMLVGQLRRGPSKVESLAALAEARFGAPPGGESPTLAVGSALRLLAAEGLVTLE